MKTIFTGLLVAFVFVASGQDEKYTNAMNSAIAGINQSQTNAGLMDAANQFERIGISEKDKWLPFYYASYAYIVASYQEQDLAKKDQYLDKAQQLLDNAFELSGKESELFALQAFLYPSRIIADPMARGVECLGKMNWSLDKAIELNPENPRSYYLRAITLLNMPEAFGGGAEVARPHFEKAKEKFDLFTPESALSPNWGKELNEAELGKLNSK